MGIFLGSGSRAPLLNLALRSDDHAWQDHVIMLGITLVGNGCSPWAPLDSPCSPGRSPGSRELRAARLTRQKAMGGRFPPSPTVPWRFPIIFLGHGKLRTWHTGDSQILKQNSCS